MGKTYVAVLASHDSLEKNCQLKSIFENAISNPETQKLLDDFGFIFTGGTYDRLFEDRLVEAPQHSSIGAAKPETYKLSPDAKQFMRETCTIIRLPGTAEGGVIILSSLIVRRQVTVLWALFSPITTHLLFPENLALMRLADQCRVKKLMNSGSVTEWLHGEARRDVNLNRRDHDSFATVFPGSLQIRMDLERDEKIDKLYHLRPHKEKCIDFAKEKNEKTLTSTLKNAVVALISHDALKSRMTDFVVDYEHELAHFGKIIATGTTGSVIEEAAPELKATQKVHRYHSGPKGGDVEIATQILFGACHVVIFFVDPLHPHPHTEDIRVVFGACMIENNLRMLSNEMQARAWMDHYIRCI